MRILWLQSDLLLPLDKGGKLRTWHLLRHLARRHEVTYLAFADPATRKADLDGMKQVAAHVHTVPWSDAPKRSWRFHADATAHLVDPLPYAVAQYRRMKRYEAQALRRFDAVLAVSDADGRTFARIYPDAIRQPIHVVPTGVDTEYFTPLRRSTDSPSLVFTGSMDWLPNEDAMVF